MVGPAVEEAMPLLLTVPGTTWSLLAAATMRRSAGSVPRSEGQQGGVDALRGKTWCSVST